MASYALTLGDNDLLINASSRQTYGHLLICLGHRVPDLRMLGPTMSISIGLSAFVMTQEYFSSPLGTSNRSMRSQ
jgi:hypothetical protein